MAWRRLLTGEQGFRFAPHIRDRKDRRLYLFPDQETPAILSPMIGGTLDVAHLTADWTELLQLATSIRSGTSTASPMLRRLPAYSRQKGLAVALRGLDRLKRTLFTLDWLRNPTLRRRANAGLNKGEARNALVRAIFFNRLGEMWDRSFDSQVFRASGLNLPVWVDILWDTRYLEAALAELTKFDRRLCVECGSPAESWTQALATATFAFHRLGCWHVLTSRTI
jgi:TnpA family transposase